MPAPKGRPKPKNSGMKKGAKMKKTLEWEEFGRIVIDGTLPQVQSYFDSLKENPALLYEEWLKLIEYFKPKLARTETKGENTIEIIFKRETDDKDLPDI